MIAIPGILFMILGTSPAVYVRFIFRRNSLASVELDLSDRGFVIEENPEIPYELIAWLKSYASKKALENPFFRMDELSPFTQCVLDSLQAIPFGEVKSYQEVAESIHKPLAARAVGSACGRNPFPLFIPCHRVVATSGLGGFALDMQVKKRLLEHELGIEIANSFDIHQWRSKDGTKSNGKKTRLSRICQ